MPLAITTDDVEPRHRIPYWVDVASKTYFDHRFSAEPGAFAGRLNAGKLDKLGLSRCESSPCKVTRTRREIARDGIDDILLGIWLKGHSLLTQGERKVILGPGTMLLQDTGRPFKHDFIEHTTSIVVSIPRQEIRARMGTRDLERVLSTGLPLAGLTADFISGLTTRVDALEQGTHRRLADQALDLISMAFTGNDAGVPLSSVRANALRRLKSEIEKRLSDPGLKPADAAHAARISVRYANALLAKEGLSLERYIVQRRLECCRRALEDPLQAHRLVGEIAFAWGFSDHSHFTRRFRETFGMTPGDCRQVSRLIDT